MKSVGIKKKFCLDEPNPYEAVREKLLKLSEANTVTLKLRQLVDASETILRCVDEYYRSIDEDFELAMYFNFLPSD